MTNKKKIARELKKTLCVFVEKRRRFLLKFNFRLCNFRKISNYQISNILAFLKTKLTKTTNKTNKKREIKQTPLGKVKEKSILRSLSVKCQSRRTLKLCMR